MRKIKTAFFILNFVILIVLVACMTFLYIFPIKYKDLINLYANYYKISPSLISAVINCESGYNPNAISNVGAIGLMQLMPSTAKYLAELLKINEFDTQLLYDAETNIMLGTFYISRLLAEFQDTKTALIAYNAGPTKVKTWLFDEKFSQNGITLDSCPYPSTNNYVQKVFDNIKVYKLFY